METQNQGWYESDRNREIQERFDQIATKLCDDARQQGMELPLEIDFWDNRQEVATFTIEYDRAEWNWKPWARGGDIQNPIKATLRSAGKGHARLTETFRVPEEAAAESGAAA